jgi:DNA-binding Lrp family transcriptional regulator
MYTTIIHPLRKAYNLSINEYCVMEAIRTLSNNTKYKGWCLMSQGRIADALDLSRQWMGEIYKALEAKELIERRKDTREDTAVRTMDEWNEWFMADKADILLALKTKDSELSTILPRKSNNSLQGVKKVDSPCKESLHPCKESLHNTNRDTNIDTLYNLPKGKLSEARKSGKGRKKEIDNMLIALKGVIGIEAFVDSSIERNMARHCNGLMEKIGRKEFRRRLEFLLADNFHSKNCNRIKYIYNNIKGFKEPKTIKPITIIS